MKEVLREMRLHLRRLKATAQLFGAPYMGKEHTGIGRNGSNRNANGLNSDQHCTFGRCIRTGTLQCRPCSGTDFRESVFKPLLEPGG